MQARICLPLRTQHRRSSLGGACGGFAPGLHASGPFLSALHRFCGHVAEHPLLEASGPSLQLALPAGSPLRARFPRKPAGRPAPPA